MSITVTKGDGVTVLTMAANADNAWPPLCQILGALCYNPLCCSVSQGLRRLQATSQSVLGTIQIMVGLLNIGLGGVLISTSPREMTWLGTPYWLGGVWIAVGIMCILAGRFPSVCLVGIAVFMNVAGAVFAITGIVMFAIDLGDVFFYWMCGWNSYYDNDDYGYRRQYYNDYGNSQVMTTPSVEKMRHERLRQEYTEKCKEMKYIAVMVMKSLDIVLLILAVLQLCVTVSSVVIGIKTLKNHKKEAEGKSCQDVEYYSPLLEEVTTTNPAA